MQDIALRSTLGTGLPGTFEGHCPPHYASMRDAVEALTRRKFGPGGPFDGQTPGPWRESGRVRASAQVHSDEFKDCVATMAQHVFDRHGKFPATVPAIFTLTYLQAHHLDLEYYDRHYRPGATSAGTVEGQAMPCRRGLRLDAVARLVVTSRRVYPGGSGGGGTPSRRDGRGGPEPGGWQVNGDRRYTHRLVLCHRRILG